MLLKENSEKLKLHRGQIRLYVNAVPGHFEGKKCLRLSPVTRLLLKLVCYGHPAVVQIIIPEDLSNVFCKVKSQQGAGDFCEGGSRHAGLREGKCTERQHLEGGPKKEMDFTQLVHL